MDDKLYEILTKLPRRNLIHLMWDALDEMQAYNGRSRQECIMLAVGNAAESKEHESTGEISYRIKSLAELKRSTHYMGP
jgi:hypothetical protein